VKFENQTAVAVMKKGRIATSSRPTIDVSLQTSARIKEATESPAAAEIIAPKHNPESQLTARITRGFLQENAGSKTPKNLFML
jgi:hypothetical protein